MGRHYSNDLRERVAAAVLAGRSCREVAALFSVSVASAVKWSQRLRQTGSAAARPVTARCALARESSPWSLENSDLPGGPAVRPPRRPICPRRADQRQKLCRLHQANAGADLVTRRYRHHGQSRQPYKPSGAQSHSRSWRQTPVPATLQPRPELHRAGLRQAQNPAPQGCRAHRRGNLETHRHVAQRVQTTGMRKLSQKLRICVKLGERDSRDDIPPRAPKVSLRAPANKLASSSSGHVTWRIKRDQREAPFVGQ